MAFEHFLESRTITAFSPGEREILECMVAGLRGMEPGEILVRQGVPVDVSTILVSGMMSRHLHDRAGRRHMVGVHFAGDFVDLHAFPLKVLDHDISALTRVEVATIPHARLTELQDAFPKLARGLWFSTLLDAAIHRRWSLRLSSLDAAARIAHFFCESNARLLAIGQSDGRRFELPLTQAQLGEACGLTGVHVNRVLRELRDRRLCTFKSSWVEIQDLPGLARLGQFTAGYLYLNETTREVTVGLRRNFE